MMGEHGGSAFLIIYLLFTICLAIPGLTAEWTLGRSTGKGPIGALSSVFGKTWGRRIGGLIVFTMIVSTSYYLVVIGNITFTAFFSIFNGFSESTILEFDGHISNGWLQYVFGLVVLGFAMLVLHLGVNKGIESVSRLFVPFFAIVILYLAINALFLPGAVTKVAEFLRPDFSVLTPEHIFAALGQSFFSVGLAGTIMVIYGSYMPADQNMLRTASFTALGDVGAAFLASLFIVPTILVFNLDLSQGPTLVFSTLPKLFSVMAGGRVLGSFFLLALSLIAFLSAIGALEAIVGSISEEMKLRSSRGIVILIILLIEAAIMLPSSLEPEIIGVLDLFFGSGMQMLGSTIAVIAVAWGIGRLATKAQIFGLADKSWHDIYFAWLKWVLPGVMCIVLISYLISNL
jgi:NSS family neurotransmitter:Na+ symporter